MQSFIYTTDHWQRAGAANQTIVNLQNQQRVPKKRKTTQKNVIEKGLCDNRRTENDISFSPKNVYDSTQQQIFRLFGADSSNIVMHHYFAVVFALYTS